jgi:hypothetical protein
LRTGSRSVQRGQNPCYATFWITLDLVLPDANDPPSCPPQSLKIPKVAYPVSLDFALPLFGKFQTPRRESPSVPEIALDEYHDLGLPEHDVRPPPQIAGMLVEGKTRLPQQLCNDALRVLYPSRGCATSMRSASPGS